MPGTPGLSAGQGRVAARPAHSPSFTKLEPDAAPRPKFDSRTIKVAWSLTTSWRPTADRKQCQDYESGYLSKSERRIIADCTSRLSWPYQVTASRYLVDSNAGAGVGAEAAYPSGAGAGESAAAGASALVSQPAAKAGASGQSSVSALHKVVKEMLADPSLFALVVLPSADQMPPPSPPAASGAAARAASKPTPCTVRLIAVENGGRGNKLLTGINVPFHAQDRSWPANNLLVMSGAVIVGFHDKVEPLMQVNLLAEARLARTSDCKRLDYSKVVRG